MLVRGPPVARHGSGSNGHRRLQPGQRDENGRRAMRAAASRLFRRQAVALMAYAAVFVATAAAIAAKTSDALVALGFLVAGVCIAVRGPATRSKDLARCRRRGSGSGLGAF